MEYNTTISTGGFGAGIPGKINSLRQAQPQGVLSSLFNMSPAMKSRINPQAMQEMNRQQGDQFRNTAWGMANNLERDYTQANNNMQMNQLQAASGQANNYFDTINDAMNTQRQQELSAANRLMGLRTNQMQFMLPYLSQLFNGMSG